MQKLITNDFRVWLAKLFKRRFSDTTTYAAIANIVERYVTDGYTAVDSNGNTYSIELIASNSANNATIMPDFDYFYVFATMANKTSIANSIQGSHYSIYDNLQFGKRALASDVSLMIKRFEWEAGTVYSIFDHESTCLHNENFYVMTKYGSKYKVFQCLDNCNNSPSLQEPTTVLGYPGEIILTADSSDYSYVWMFMYEFDEETYKKFATTNYIPLTSNGFIDYKAGALNSVSVETPGFGYSTFTGKVITASNNKVLKLASTDGFNFTKNNFYQNYAIYISEISEVRRIVESALVGGELFVTVDQPFTKNISTTNSFVVSPAVTITGDGTGAVAISNVGFNGEITSITMVNQGIDYTNATAVIEPILSFVDADHNTIDDLTGGVATIRPIISPPRAHGGDLAYELFADKVCVSVDYIQDQHPLVDFDQFGLMINPIYKENSINVNSPTLFSVGEVIIQEATSTVGTITAIDLNTNKITLKNVKGSFVQSESIYGLTNKNSSIVTLINNDNSKYSASEIVDNSGTILLIKNDGFTTTRTGAQTERIKLIIDF